MIALVGCGSPAVVTPAPTPAIDQKAESQKVIDADNVKLKAEATKADFVEINGHYDQVKAKAVFAEGKVSAIDSGGVFSALPNFSLSQKEGSGFGIYLIVDMFNELDLKDGDTVKVYGHVSDPKLNKAWPGPTIWCPIVEKK